MIRETDKTLHATVKYAEDLADEVAARVDANNSQVERNTSDIVSLKQRADAKDEEVLQIRYAVEGDIRPQIRNLADDVEGCKDITDQINFLIPNRDPVEYMFNVPNIERVQAEIAPITDRVESVEDLACAAQDTATQAQTSAATAADAANEASERANAAAASAADAVEMISEAAGMYTSIRDSVIRNTNTKANANFNGLHGTMWTGTYLEFEYFIWGDGSSDVLKYRIVKGGRIFENANGARLPVTIWEDEEEEEAICTIGKANNLIGIQIDTGVEIVGTAEEVSAATGFNPKMAADSAKLNGKSEGELMSSLGGFTDNQGKSESGTISLVADTYYNITGESVLLLPSNLTCANQPTPFRFLVHLADGVSSSRVTIVDPNNRVIVTNNSTTAYRASIAGSSVGLSPAWKLVTARIFKNPSSVEIVYLEV